MAEAAERAARPAPGWRELEHALGPEAEPELLARLTRARQDGARLVWGEGGRLRLDLRAAYGEEAELAAARAGLMPYAARLAAALARLEAGAMPTPGSSRPARVLRPEPPPTVWVEDDAALREAVAALAAQPAVGLDTETTGLSPRRDHLRLVQVGVSDRVWVVDTWRVGDLGPLARLLADGRIRKVGHNLKFDLLFLAGRGVGGATALFDTMLASQLLAAGEEGVSHSLRAVCRRHLGLALDKREQAGDWSGEISPAQRDYAALDVALLVPLAAALENELAKQGMARAAAIEMEALPAVAALEGAGMAVDAEALGRTLAQGTAEREAAAARARALLPPRPRLQSHLLPEPLALASAAEVTASLRALGVEVGDLREETLARWGDRPEVAAYLAWRRLDKRVAFLDGLARYAVADGRWARVYPEYWQIGASSGRMSCSSPNLQQVPRDAEVRRLFAPPPGRALVIADYSQVELRIVAALSGDERMREAFGRGEDLHRVTAALLAGKAAGDVSREERQAAKAANFGLVYSMGARGLMEYARQGYGVDMGLEEAQRVRERFFAAYPGVAAWHDRARREARAAGGTRTVTGRLRRLGPDARPGDIYNAPVQGSGADIFKAALSRVWRAVEPLGALPTAAVHDELVLECDAEYAPEVAARVGAEMRAAAEALLPEVPFPVEVHVGAHWGEKV
ncbi:MAG: bifunctional 3'-5' exonuclease/DNA polymerase [Firmicutes bacterium]|nr:bifunctional 3'-5' exonuclease/DNA polymerase [Bacillota bacterium]